VKHNNTQQVIAQTWQNAQGRRKDTTRQRSPDALLFDIPLLTMDLWETSSAMYTAVVWAPNTYSTPK
jgi:hypothetical protein